VVLGGLSGDPELSRLLMRRFVHGPRLFRPPHGLLLSGGQALFGLGASVFGKAPDIPVIIFFLGLTLIYR